MIPSSRSLLVADGDWRAYLEVAARFHQYSANNLLLIVAQRPDATRVAGYRTWLQLGRQVRKGGARHPHPRVLVGGEPGGVSVMPSLGGPTR